MMRAEAAHAPSVTHARPGRALDRRRGAAAVIAGITSALAIGREPRLLRERFESELASVIRARSVLLRDDPLPPTLTNTEVTAVPVPCPGGDGRARIEALFDPGVHPDEWTYQVLETAAHIGTLILEIERANGYGRTLRPRPDGAAPLIGSSAAIRMVRERIERVALTDFTVLIEGESGSGKELVARQIHELSRRRRGPFIAVNCAAIVETLLEAELFGIEERTATGVRGRRGKFEHAHEGTLFLDEVSDLSPAAQAKLLRAIQDLMVERVGASTARRIDTRIIVATNKPLASMVDQGRFRLDLFYRLHGIEVQVPPLRHRREDILELAHHFLNRHRAIKPLDMSAGAADALLAYDWPGNVRELERTIERAVALAGSDRLEVEDLPPALIGGYMTVLVPSLTARETMRAWGSRYARVVLERCGNNKRRASRELGISYHTLQAYLKYRPDEARQA
jgi:transcriptional regulator with PAS, ATPase and Fis domain